MTLPLASIVINNFNYARFLPQSIESALAQTYPRTEVIVVDDASSDTSPEIIRRYSGRLRAIIRDRNAGQAAAINEGFRASRGEIVVFLDADDYLYPEAMERIACAQRPELSKVQYRLDLVDASGHRIDLFPTADIRFDSGDVVPLLLATGRYSTTVTTGNAFARSTLERILPVPESSFRIAADGYLVTLAPLYGPVASIETPLGAYRRHGDNLWRFRGPTLAGDLRRSIEHDTRRYEALRARAREVGLDVTPEPGLRDHFHLMPRLGSLRMEPALHPYRQDSRCSLALRGLVASLTAALPWTRRVLLAALYLAVGFMPRAVARRGVAWYLAPDSRPPWVVRLSRVLRRLAG
jgi:glycosyltransferase involved in cell wall biosynthesis